MGRLKSAGPWVSLFRIASFEAGIFYVHFWVHQEGRGHGSDGALSVGMALVLLILAGCQRYIYLLDAKNPYAY